MTPSSSRRFVGGLVRVALVVLGGVLVVGYVRHRMPSHRRVVRVQTEVPSTDSLGPGDLRIYNADSSVDLVLQGNRILAGLSPKTVARVRGALDTSETHDTTGFGGAISQIVKRSVASAIGTHVSYPLSDIRDIRYDKGQLEFDWTDGGHHQLFNKTTVDGKNESDTFRREDAQRFIEAVRARKGEIGSSK